MNTTYQKLETAILEAGGALANFTARKESRGNYDGWNDDVVLVKATVDGRACDVYPLSDGRVQVVAWGVGAAMLVNQRLTEADVDAIIAGATAPDAEQDARTEDERLAEFYGVMAAHDMQADWSSLSMLRDITEAASAESAYKNAVLAAHHARLHLEGAAAESVTPESLDAFFGGIFARVDRERAAKTLAASWQ